MQKLGFWIFPSSGKGSSGSIISVSGKVGNIIPISSLGGSSSFIKFLGFIPLILDILSESLFVVLSFLSPVFLNEGLELFTFIFFETFVLLWDLLDFRTFDGEPWLTSIALIKGGSL